MVKVKLYQFTVYCLISRFYNYFVFQEEQETESITIDAVTPQSPLETLAARAFAPSSVSGPPSRRRRVTQQDSSNRALEAIADHFTVNQREDKHHAFGNYVAFKLRDLKNERQRIIAEKIINDALYLAEMESLTLTSEIRESEIQVVQDF